MTDLRPGSTINNKKSVINMLTLTGSDSDTMTVSNGTVDIKSSSSSGSSIALFATTTNKSNTTGNQNNQNNNTTKTKNNTDNTDEENGRDPNDRQWRSATLTESQKEQL